MAFSINPVKCSSKQLRRVARGRLDKAVKAVQSGSSEGVHDARKRLKELRALLRLVREPLGAARFSALNQRLGDTARQLSSARDAVAMVESWDALVRHEPARFAAAAMASVRERLQARVSAGVGQPPERDSLIAALQQTATEVAEWRIKGKGFSLFEEGLLRSYRAGRAALRRVRCEPGDEALHDWRKRVKDHGYHARLLHQAWPQHCNSWHASLSLLAEKLGDYQDLSVMQTLLAEQPELFGDVLMRASIAEGISHRRVVLHHEALDLGRRLYAEKPSALVARWALYWRVARRA
ncbi:CHAD domain-containing protein [Pseudomonas cuatrocienegasensis]|uniref:CHAD domain-containing protein n=1 Tax=Pseudomonas cuatrocienegasensis TaxID=543360 RepID=A0ABY1B6B6_9PSED|nr:MULTISPECIES: CHAD domain-containing protein [Pseudomonas]OEC36783.1 hypothetical protein A7D25_02650 [Pseudomonas sp. 21C1]SEQ06486.1 CHAD domain-containing protein [Pseudomonas cuatrocienegasensis]